jgi:thymidylate kinase
VPRRRGGEGVLSETVQALAGALRLFEAFEKSGVVHCHFKSNEHLAAGLAGLTDLDVLVDAQHADQAQRALLESGFKRFASRWAGAYPAVEDYLACDDERARLIHVHLHYALVAGEPYLKNYRLDLGRELLQRRVIDPESGVRTSDPDAELTLLMLRLALKLRWRDGVLAWLGRPYVKASDRRELDWLMARSKLRQVCEFAEQTLGAEVARTMHQLLVAGPHVSRLRRLRAYARHSLVEQRTYGQAAALALRALREAARWFSVANRRLLGLPVVTRRANPRGGRIVAFLGPDGSGKSTLVRETASWLGWKLDVYQSYFGSGDGPVSLLRWPLKLALGAYRRARPAARSGARRGALHRVRWIWAIALAFEKRKRMRRVIRARNRGLIVVCDRYPQAQVEGFNDGPLIVAWLDTSGWRGRVARWERGVYRELAANAPDVAIKLDVTPEQASARKPDVERAEVSRRRTALAAIDYGPRCRHVLLDADRPLEEVLRDVQRAVWRCL